MKFISYKRGARKYFNSIAPPAGTIIAYAPSGTVPSGWLKCDGTSNLSTTVYSSLFAAIGYQYGGSSGSFSVPDMRGRAIIGAGNGLGNNASGIGKISGSSLTNRTLAATASTNETITLTASQSGLQSHNHSVTETAHSHTITAFGNGAHDHQNRLTGNTAGPYATGGTNNVYGLFNESGTSVYSSLGPNPGSFTSSISTATSKIIDASGGTANTVTATSATASAAHTNLQPFIIMQYIIKT